ncbi:YceD family protein [Amaricoccus sp. B4]|uniref:YceD family protein n=1 Tax=Amaricoccus sp. B4 TaxID=3368557 RepID=UPI0037159C80
MIGSRSRPDGGIMRELARTSPDNPEFARVVELARLQDGGDFAFDISPEPAEAQAIARLMGAQALRKLRFQGRLSPLERKGWQLEGAFGATVIQTCVVTLEPVTTRIDQPVRRRYEPMTEPVATDIMLSAEDDEDVEPLRPTIDLGLVALETLALALPAYPRKDGAALGPQVFAEDGVTPLEDEDVKPFAALAALKDRLDNNS